jgi:hypothetical protein
MSRSARFAALLGQERSKRFSCELCDEQGRFTELDLHGQQNVVAVARPSTPLLPDDSDRHGDRNVPLSQALVDLQGARLVSLHGNQHAGIVGDARAQAARVLDFFFAFLLVHRAWRQPASSSASTIS